VTEVLDRHAPLLRTLLLQDAEPRLRTLALDWCDTLAAGVLRDRKINTNREAVPEPEADRVAAYALPAVITHRLISEIHREDLDEVLARVFRRDLVRPPDRREGGSGCAQQRADDAESRLPTDRVGLAARARRTANPGLLG